MQKPSLKRTVVQSFNQTYNPVYKYKSTVTAIKRAKSTFKKMRKSKRLLGYELDGVIGIVKPHDIIAGRAWIGGRGGCKT
ncbi:MULTISPECIES: hypothetical protein [Atopobium]|nr:MULTISPECIES: hypothetical protein [Atopobium]MBS4874051.1 hypothetical protein [Atopobium minutum]